MTLFRRKDGDLVRDVPNYRRIMPFLMPTRTEAAVLFEQRLDARPALEAVRAFNERTGGRATFFHVVLWALVGVFAARPRLNRFVMGGRLYQRRGIWLSYSGKRAFDDASPLFVAKHEFTPAASFADVVATSSGEVGDARRGVEKPVDRELRFFLRLPGFLLRWFVGLARWLDGHNLLPHSMIRPDPMYASAFVANLGSVKLDAAYHHNYEWGTIPIFVTIGRFHEDGTVTLRWTYDERVEDGFYCARALDLLRERIENPGSLSDS